MKRTAQKSGDRQRVAAVAKRVTRRKKLVIAFVLFFAMAVLWIRVFVGKGGPKAASAEY